MSGSAKPRPKTASEKGKLAYRGILLHRPATRSRFSASEIKKAVEDAVAKNADTLARPR